MSNPLVSVLIPCYNAERFIGETLESVLGQTWRNIEIIVVDDGSSDSSCETVQTYKDKRITLVKQPNSGASAARNRAFQASKGDYIQFLDADDILDAAKIETQLRRFQTSTASVASAEWGRFYNDISETRFSPETNWEDLAPVEWLIRSRQDGLGMLFPALWLIPRPVAQKAGPWDETLSLGDDGEYFTRVVLAADRVLFCRNARCYYRSGIPGSLSGRKSPKAWASQMKVTESCQKHVMAREDSERVRRCFALSWQHLAHAAYPYDWRLAEEAQERAVELHPITIRPDGGLAFKIVSRLAGWRIARKLQFASGRA